MKRILLTAILLLVGHSAHAGILVEPYLGYHDGSYRTPGDTTVDIHGPTFGARLGSDSFMFMFGADYMTGKWEDEADPTSNDATPTNLGVFIGYSPSQMFRFYFTYAFDADLELENSNGSTDLSGKSMKLTLGIAAFSQVNVNLEYMQATYNKADGQTIQNGDYNLKVYGILLSVPLSL